MLTCALTCHDIIKVHRSSNTCLCCALSINLGNVLFQGLRVHDGLRPLCKQYGLMVTGKKDELIERILNHEARKLH